MPRSWRDAEPHYERRLPSRTGLQRPPFAPSFASPIRVLRRRTAGILEDQLAAVRFRSIGSGHASSSFISSRKTEAEPLVLPSVD